MLICTSETDPCISINGDQWSVMKQTAAHGKQLLDAVTDPEVAARFYLKHGFYLDNPSEHRILIPAPREGASKCSLEILVFLYSFC